LTIKALTDKIERFRQELRKAVVLIRQRTQEQQYKAVKLLQNGSHADIEKFIDDGLHTMF
jgi:hypothetical protein